MKGIVEQILEFILHQNLFEISLNSFSITSEWEVGYFLKWNTNRTKKDNQECVYRFERYFWADSQIHSTTEFIRDFIEFSLNPIWKRSSIANFLEQNIIKNALTDSQRKEDRNTV